VHDQLIAVNAFRIFMLFKTNNTQNEQRYCLKLWIYQYKKNFLTYQV